MLISLREILLDKIQIIDRKSAATLKRHVLMHVQTGYIAQGKHFNLTTLWFHIISAFLT